MFKFTIIMSFFFFLLSCGINSQPENSSTSYLKGFTLPVNLMQEEDYVYNSLRESEKLVDIIKEKRLKITRFKKNTTTDVRISEFLIRAADCFKVDPFILFGLIQQESSFNQYAVSRTGAAGLTQFTTIGIKEVYDQLGRRGANHAIPATSAYLKEQINSCTGGISQPWKRFSYKGFKKYIKRITNQALIFSAILLKGLIVVEKKKNSNLSIEELYWNALFRYNGDPKDQVKYADKIMKNASDLAASLNVSKLN